jgi:oligoribonuclease NrnB/cAMP/cGMP phosphodiesterase (DHH superfamily)
VWRAWGDGARYVPRSHDDALDPSRVEDQRVVFVDIAPPVGVVEAIAERAAELIVLDHHVSARERYSARPELQARLTSDGHRIHFDMDHSGAVLAWNHFHPGKTAPDLLRYVEDQDLWNWKLPRSEEVNAAIGIETRRALHLAHPVALGSRRVEGVNALHHRSHIGHELCKRATFGHPVGVVYRLTDRRVDISIYSIGDFDVSAIAAEYGGGGHRNASGFSVSLSDWIELFVT